MKKINYDESFTRTPNLVFDKLYESDFTKRQLNILILIIRLTSGFHQTEVIISRSDFRLCGIGGNVIKNELKKLADMAVITILDPKMTVIKINPHIAQWRVPTTKYIDLLPKLRTEIFSKQMHNVLNLRNEKIKRANNDNVNIGAKDIKDIMKENNKYRF